MYVSMYIYQLYFIEGNVWSSSSILSKKMASPIMQNLSKMIKNMSNYEWQGASWVFNANFYNSLFYFQFVCCYHHIGIPSFAHRRIYWHTRVTSWVEIWFDTQWQVLEKRNIQHWGKVWSLYRYRVRNIM